MTMSDKAELRETKNRVLFTGVTVQDATCLSRNTPKSLKWST